MTTFGDQLYQFGGAPVGGFFSTGTGIFVRPVAQASGSGLGTGKAPYTTLATALEQATADKNEVVYMISEGNGASSTTDYQSVALDWDKDSVHLIGINSGNNVAQRSRIAQLSTATAVEGLLTVSGNNCLIANIHVFQGVDDATSLTAVLVSGDRNHFYNCHFAGIGNATQDVADNCSLQVTGSENLFENCTIGLDTITRATATYEMQLSGGATRNTFRNCIIETHAGDAGFAFLDIPATGIDRWVLFDNCTFINAIQSTATTMTEALAVASGTSPNGLVLLKNCTVVGATDWEASGESARVYIDGAAPTNNTSGLAVLVEAT